MIQSMTGYGKAVAEAAGKKVVVEIKSLNSKAMDISTRIPLAYREHELDIRSRITAALERGKVDFSIYFDQSAPSGLQTINVAAFRNYMQQLDGLVAETGAPMPQDLTALILRLPDVMTGGQTEDTTPEEWESVSRAVDSAIQALVEYRKVEGNALEKKFREKIQNITALLAQVEPYEKDRVARIKERMRQSLQDAVGASAVDQNRFEQEMIYYIEKLDISEEKQRLSNHLEYFIHTLEDGHGQGKKLGFIAQEMGREINTLGSKSNQAEMQNLVVRMKDELEQIKEQVLNAM